MLYKRQFDTDASENYLVYRRDLIYTVNYATTQTIAAPQVIAPVMNITDTSGNPIKTILE
jgi:ribosomal protein S24E